MDSYKCRKGIGPYFIFLYLILINLLIILAMYLVDLYMILSFIKVALIIIDIYGIYYLLLSATLKYIIDKDYLYINGIWGLKNIKISFDDIEGYKISKNKINGVKLYGVGRNKFAFGRYVIEKIGITRMFTTYTGDVIYLKTKDINYAISPDDTNDFIGKLEKKDIKLLDWERKISGQIILHKQKNFIIPFIIESIIIVIFTITPLILYLKRLIPEKMPLSFDSKFHPVRMGSGKQFAFKQMTYGVLNMAILFCMYYATYFHAKYDKKSANKYIYVSLIISIVFFLMQIKTIFEFII